MGNDAVGRMNGNSENEEEKSKVKWKMSLRCNDLRIEMREKQAEKWMAIENGL